MRDQTFAHDYFDTRFLHWEHGFYKTINLIVNLI